MATGARKTQYQVVHEISQQFGFGQTAGVIGILPAGGILHQSHIQVSQVWNGTTNTISVGTTPGGTQIFNAVDLKTLARSDGLAAIAIMGPLAVDTPIYAAITSTGPAPTQGVATVWCDFLPGVG